MALRAALSPRSHYGLGAHFMEGQSCLSKRTRGLRPFPHVSFHSTAPSNSKAPSESTTRQKQQQKDAPSQDKRQTPAEDSAKHLKNINNQTLGTSANAFPIVTLPSGQAVPTGTMGALLINIRAYDEGDDEKRRFLEPALRAAVPVLFKVGMFDLFAPEDWIRGGGPGRTRVGEIAKQWGQEQ